MYICDYAFYYLLSSASSSAVNGFFVTAKIATMISAPINISTTYQTCPSMTPVIATIPPNATTEDTPCTIPNAPAIAVPIAHAIQVCLKSLPANGQAPSVIPPEESRKAEIPTERSAFV